MLSFRHYVQTGSAAQPASYPMGIHAIGVLRAGLYGGYSPHVGTEFNACTFTSTPSRTLLSKHGILLQFDKPVKKLICPHA
jgi:hypothetical protein